MSLIYEASRLIKCYDGVTALDIPRFTLERGAALTLEGGNGSGKSTFLRLLAFLETPTSGSLQFLGEGEPRRACTLLLQDPWLLHLSVFANVTLGLKLRGIKENLRQKYHAAMQDAGFDEPELFARRKPGSLSGGERQRAALASRLILEPAVLLLDEPTAHVDAQSARHILGALRKARERGTTIVCATHDEDLALAINACTMKMRKPG